MMRETSPFYLARSVVFLLSLLWVTNCLAQSQGFRQYLPVNGLPSSEVYAITQDKDGFIWFATDLGVARFDGYEFQNFSRADGLPDIEVYVFAHDSKGRVWVCGTSKMVAFFEDGCFHQPSLNKYVEEISSDFMNVNAFKVISENEVDFGFTRGVPVKATNDGLQLYFSDTLDSIHLLVHENADGSILVGSHGKMPNRGKRAFNFIDVDDHSIRFPFKNENRIALSNGTRLANGDLVLVVNNHFVKVREGKIIQYRNLPFIPTSALMEDKEGNLWVGTIQKGALRFPGGDLEGEFTNELSAYSVTDVFQDRDGGYWFSTMDDGVFYKPGFHFKYFPLSFSGGSVQLMDIHEDELALGMRSGEIHRVDLSKNVLVSSEPGKGIATMMYSPNGKLVSRRWGQAVFAHPLDERVQVRARNRWLHFGSDGINYFVRRNSILAYRSSNIKDVVRDAATERFITCSYLDSDNQLWLGTRTGLIRFSAADGLKELSFPELEEASVRHIEGDEERGLLWIATKEKGLFLLCNGVLRPVLELQEKSPGVSLNAVDIDQDGVAWVASNRGLFRIEMTGQYPGKVSTETRHFDYSNGLSSHEIRTVLSYGHRVFLGTSDGLFHFDSRHLPKEAALPKPFLNKVEMNSKPIGNPNEEFLHTQNYFAVAFSALNYSLAGKIRYRYRLIGADNQWVQTQSTEAYYPKLTPGDYRFEVQAMSADGHWNPESTNYPFSILQPFWQAIWFQLVVIVSLLLSTVVFMRWRMVAADRKRLLVNATTKAEQRALRAQINPHFIFNALNSIQKFITNSDQHSAQKYLSVFASVIRRSLNHSDKEFVSLQEEIELSQSYVKLESLRNESRIDYKIVVDPQLNPYTVEIPPMLIQPFVENAIWHGLQPKQGEGWVRVSFSSIDNETVLVEIEDNGVGRKLEAIEAGIQSKDRPSGIGITDHRIRLLWEKWGIASGVEIIDLKNESGAAKGTLVRFKVPMRF